MSILIDKDTQVIVQDLTGKTGVVVNVQGLGISTLDIGNFRTPNK